MSEERLHEVRASLACYQRAGCMTKRMEAQRSQSRGVPRARVATAHSGAIEPPAEPRTEDVVVAARVVATVGQARERGRRNIGERQRSRLPTLGRPLDPGAERTVDDHEAALEID